MKIGAGLALMNSGEKPDFQVYQESLSLSEQVEQLGFHSIWTVEHHFSGHSPVPNALQLLSYVAARTSSLMLGTAVIVLPWHHPIRVAEEIAALDILSGGRTLLGLGRGTSVGEFNGFQIPMEESRERFTEAVRIIKLGLSQELFSYEGRFFRIPEIAIRPRPISSPERRMYGAGTSPESIDLMAELGLGLMISPERNLETARGHIRRHRELAERAATAPPGPVCHLYVSVHAAEDGARARGERYMAPMVAMLDRHYGISKNSLAGVKGYEHYVKHGKAGAWWGSQDQTQAVHAFMDRHLVGTPDQCIERLQQMKAELGLDHFVGEFSYGGMPLAECMENMGLFAKTVIPAINGH